MEEKFKTKQLINQIIAIACYVSYENSFLISNRRQICVTKASFHNFTAVMFGHLKRDEYYMSNKGIMHLYFEKHTI